LDLSQQEENTLKQSNYIDEKKYINLRTKI